VRWVAVTVDTAPEPGTTLQENWCAQWNEHAEAVSRLEALWRSWEVLRREPGLGMASWFVNHLDPNLSVLLSRGGTFSQCSPDRHESLMRLPTASTPGSTGASMPSNDPGVAPRLAGLAREDL